MSPGTEAEERTWLERVLGLVTEVRAGEGVTALLLTLNLFLLMTSYYVLKPIRDALIVNVEGGPEYKSYMGGAIAIALLAAVPAYARIAQRTRRDRLLVGVTLFFAANLLVFLAVHASSLAESATGRLAFALVFFGWLGVFSMMIVAQAWAFANDLYTEPQGKRLFALIGLGASVGSAVGSLILRDLIAKLGMAAMFGLSAGLLVTSAALIQLVHHRETGERAARPAGAPSAARAGSPARAAAPPESGSFRLVFRHRYLTLIAAFSVVFTLVNTNGEYILSRLVKAYADELAAGGLARLEVDASVGEFYGGFYLWVNVAGVLLQSLFVSRILDKGGLRVAFFVLPAIAFVDALGIALLPLLVVARVGKILENSVDYSLNNTVRNVLWLPTTREMKYRAKQAVDSFFVRMGDVGSALFVVVLGAQLGLGVRAFAITNLVLVGLWLWLGVRIVRENAAMVAEQVRPSAEPEAVST
jgi:ATP:ADP antiporter, AAA family